MLNFNVPNFELEKSSTPKYESIDSDKNKHPDVKSWWPHDQYPDAPRDERPLEEVSSHIYNIKDIWCLVLGYTCAETNNDLHHYDKYIIITIALPLLRSPHWLPKPTSYCVKISIFPQNIIRCQRKRPPKYVRVNIMNSRQ